jgi:hypothetical protein
VFGGGGQPGGHHGADGVGGLFRVEGRMTPITDVYGV